MTKQGSNSKIILISFFLLSALALLLLIGHGFFDEEDQRVATSNGTVAINQGAKWRVYFAGDTGDIRKSSISLLQNQLNIDPSHSTLVLMGDNIYQRGLVSDKDPGRSEALERLQRQLNFLKPISGLQSIFVPGNHDWDASGPDGLNAVRREQEEVERYLGAGSFYPEDGCPGPELIEVGEGLLSLVFFNSEWWLRTNLEKPDGPEDGCSAWTEQGILLRLEELLNKAKGPVVFIQHHPLYSVGSHAMVSHCGANQDFPCPRYQHMRQDLISVLEKHPALLCAAGHDHSLQVMKSGPACKYSIVSGATTNITPVSPDKDTLFAAKKFGIMRLDIMPDSKLKLQVIEESTAWPAGSLLFALDL